MVNYRELELLSDAERSVISHYARRNVKNKKILLSFMFILFMLVAISFLSEVKRLNYINISLIILIFILMVIFMFSLYKKITEFSLGDCVKVKVSGLIKQRLGPVPGRLKIGSIPVLVPQHWPIAHNAFVEATIVKTSAVGNFLTEIKYSERSKELFSVNIDKKTYSITDEISDGEVDVYDKLYDVKLFSG